jgi:hypothetical protein
VSALPDLAAPPPGKDGKHRMHENRRVVIGGVDAHADVHQVAALDQHGALLGTEGFPTTTRGYAQLLAWLQAFGAVDVVAVESTGAYAAGLTRHLRRRQVTVLEVNQPHAHTRRRQGKETQPPPPQLRRRPTEQCTRSPCAGSATAREPAPTPNAGPQKARPSEKSPAASSATSPERLPRTPRKDLAINA